MKLSEKIIGTLIMTVIIILITVVFSFLIYNLHIKSKILKQQYDIEKTALENCDCG